MEKVLNGWRRSATSSTPSNQESFYSEGVKIMSVKFAVLDDLPIDLPELFQTDPYVGLDEDTARSIIEYFNMPELSTAQVRK